MSENPVVHFEMGYFDRERMKKFYESVFYWQLKEMGREMGNYIVAQTAETDEHGMIKRPGAINGGFYQKIDEPPLSRTIDRHRRGGYQESDTSN